MLYALKSESVLALIKAMHEVAERYLGEVDRIVRSYFRARDDMQPVSRTEPMRRKKRELVTLLDVRPKETLFAAWRVAWRNGGRPGCRSRRARHGRPSSEADKHVRSGICNDRARHAHITPDEAYRAADVQLG